MSHVKWVILQSYRKDVETEPDDGADVEQDAELGDSLIFGIL